MLKNRYYMYPRDANCSLKHVAEYIDFSEKENFPRFMLETEHWPNKEYMWKEEN